MTNVTKGPNVTNYGCAYYLLIHLLSYKHRDSIMHDVNQQNLNFDFHISLFEGGSRDVNETLCIM